MGLGYPYNGTTHICGCDVSGLRDRDYGLRGGIAVNFIEGAKRHVFVILIQQ